MSVAHDARLDDGPSWDDLARLAGVELPPPSAPFDGYRRDLELEATRYWPAVPAELEPRPRPTLPAAP